RQRVDIRLDAQLTVEQLAAGAELGHRSGAIAGEVVQPHERSVKALLERVGHQGAARVLDRVRPLASRRVRLDELIQAVEPALLPPLALQPQPLLVAFAIADAEAVEERAAIQRRRRLQPPDERLP